MPEIGDFQRTNSEFAKSEQKYPVKITFNNIRTLIFLSVQSLFESVHYRQRAIFRKKLKKIDPWSLAIEPWYGFPLLRQCHRRISVTGRRDVVAMSWRTWRV
jgi:hypothetical protein